MARLRVVIYVYKNLGYAACDKQESRFTYEAGALESEEIKARVVDILEGTEPAFKNRQLKYRLA